nr:hypothetical protein CFP56_71232 [Quercus suber]
MSDGSDDYWRLQQYYDDQQDSSILTSEWPGTGQSALPQVLGMQDIDPRIFENDSGFDIDAYSDDAGHPFPPIPLDHDHDPNRHMRYGTANPTFSNRRTPTALSSQGDGLVDDSNTINQFQLPNSQFPTQEAAHSRHGAQGVLIPGPLMHSSALSSNKEQRPFLPRSMTAPEQRQHLSLHADHSHISRRGSEEGDKNSIFQRYNSMVGRKRQRLPHTAVERRYRENLNAHLDDLRLTVPMFNRLPFGEDRDNGIKPSKCEVLRGAVEYITMLEKENADLREEVKAAKENQDTPRSNTLF